MDGDAAMQRRLDGFLASHGVSTDAEPTPDASRRMQRLLDLDWKNGLKVADLVPGIYISRRLP